MSSEMSTSVPLVMVAVLLLVPLAAVIPGAVADETVPPASPDVDPIDVQDSVLMALDWYSKNQGYDGSWRNSVGETAFIVTCFANAGYDHTNQSVQKGLEFMRHFYAPGNGSMASDFLNYDTALSLMAMSAVGDPQDEERVSGMTDFLQFLQFNGHDMYPAKEEWFLGGWPNYVGLPDASNSQFALLGLQAADLYADFVNISQETWDNASRFMTYCQNWPDTNPLDWAHNTSLPSHGDGGFVYNGYRSRTELGEHMFESYGSMTAAGLYSYLLCGDDPRQSEVAAAREWLDMEYTTRYNPRLAGVGHYYYLWTLARALAMSPNDWTVDGSGKLHDWRPEMATFFLDRQRPDGSWPGNPQTGWREEEPELAGVYALLTMQAGYMTAPDPELTIEVTGGDTVGFIDTMGREMASDVSLGLTVTDRTLTCTDPETFRKVWVRVEGQDGDTATVSATGAWGEGRTSGSMETLVLGAGGASAMVASSGFAGPFAISIVGFDEGPVLETRGEAGIELPRGETKVVTIDLVETSGEAPAVGAMFIIHAVDGVVADVDEQGVTIPAGEEGALGLTISVDGDVAPGKVWSGVVISSTAPPVPIAVEVVEPEETWFPGAMYWVIIGVLLLLIILFFVLPTMGKPTVIDDDAFDEE